MIAWLPAGESAARFIVAIILNSLWEDAILVLAVFVLLRSLRNINASTRYFAWLVTMIAAVVLPVITSLPQTTMQSPAATSTSATRTNVTQVQPPPSAQTNARRAGAVPGKPSAEAAAPRFRAPKRLYVQLPSWFASVLFIAWAVIALIIGVRLGIDLFSLERLKRDSLPLPVEFRDQMERWVKAAYGNARDVRICVSEHIEVPVAVGLFDSMILLPKHLLEQLSAGELDRISLHELAHLHRADDWTNSVQRVAQILMFFNPAVRYVGSQLDLEREVACDDWVLALTGEVRPYATCLTRMAELTAWPHRALAAPGVFVTRKGISIRIERLLNKHRNARVKVAYGVPGLVAGVLAAFFVLVNLVTPVIAYTTESASTTVAAVSQKIVLVTHLPHKQLAPPAAAVIQVKPAPAPAPQIVTKIVHDRTVIIRNKSVNVHTPRTYVHVPHVGRIPHIPYRNGAAPDINVNVPEVNVNVPEVNVHVPEMHIHVPAVNVHIPGRTMRGPAIASNGNGFSCTGCDFAGVNWAGKDMSGRSFVGADFSRANLEGANFSRANLSGVDFSHANLRNANFSGASMNGCDMSKADMTGAHFEGAHINGCNGIDARAMDQTQLRVWLTQCNGCDFQNADFHGMDLRNIHSSGMDFERANFAGADLSGARFSGANFSHANLAGAKLHGTQFSGCDFDHTDLRNVDLSDASMTGSNLSNAIMR